MIHLYFSWVYVYDPSTHLVYDPSTLLVSVYIPPQAHASSALQKLADQITDTE